MIWRVWCLACMSMIFVQLTVAGDVDFNRDVRPILADNCFECHGPDEESRAADLRLDALDDAFGWVIEPGSPDESLLIERLLSEDEDEVMPPPESKRRPTGEQIETLRKWIKQGARYEQHWAFVAPIRRSPPSIRDASWARNPIDHFVGNQLESKGFAPRPDALPRVFARRLSLALTGLPVLPERANRFADEYSTAPDQAVDAFVDELLASEAYGEHQAWSWLDASRYADTNGYQGDGYRVMWPWRDWLIRSLNENMPFDEMTKQMLAGDLMAPERHRNWKTADWIPDDAASKLLVATGFLRNHRYDTGSGTIPAESKFENAADRTETVGTVWMGMTMLCARCHSHKYDPIENREYYQLLSFFDNVPEVGSALKGASHPYIHVPTSEGRIELQRLEEKAERANAAMVAAESRLAAAQARWETLLTRFEVDHSGSTSPNIAVVDEAASPKSASIQRRLDLVHYGTRDGTTEDEESRVTRGLTHRFAQEPTIFNGVESIEKSNDPIALCAGSRAWTISFWFRPDSGDDCAIFSSVQEPERYRQGIQADWMGGKIRLRHVCRWVNSYIEFESNEKLEIGKWHHVTFRCDGRMQGLAYSASIAGRDDGMLCTHPVTNDSANIAGKAPLILGDSPFLPAFVGGLRDLRFYDRVVSRDEVVSLADSRLTVEIARIRQSDRTADESATLRLAFLESNGLTPELRDIRDAQISTQKDLREAIRNSPTTMVMKESDSEPTRVRIAGVFDSLGDHVEASTPAFLPPFPEGERDRLALARWLVHPEHPLTARVAVNRIWQNLWGRGFVDSPENFGTQCAEPLQVDLLDWLATEYVRLGWDTKKIIKLIVTSRTYRQRSDADEEWWQRDPQNRHLARGPRFRLTVAVVRDQALFLSGRLEQKVGGPPVIVDEVIGQNGQVVKLPLETSDRRRTLYTFWKRNSPHPMLAVFDVADRNQCEVRTMRTNTPLQALVTLNEPGFAAAAKSLGQRARKVEHASSLPKSTSASSGLTPQLRWTWQACTGRLPDDAVIRQLKATLEEYRQVAGGDEKRAWTALCNVLLNLDAAMTLE